MSDPQLDEINKMYELDVITVAPNEHYDIVINGQTQRICGSARISPTGHVWFEHGNIVMDLNKVPIHGKTTSNASIYENGTAQFVTEEQRLKDEIVAAGIAIHKSSGFDSTDNYHRLGNAVDALLEFRKPKPYLPDSLIERTMS